MCVGIACPAAHSQLPPTACRQDYPTASYLHPSLTSHPPSLPSFFHFLPFPPCLPVPLPPPQITAVFTRALRDLPTRPRVRSHSPRRAKKNPLKSYRAGCLLTHWLPMCVDVVFCVHIGGCCVSQAIYRNFSLSTKSSSLAHAIVSRSWSQFTLLSWCGVSMISLQDYTVKKPSSFPGRLSSPLANTHTYTGLHCTPCLCEEPTVFC